MTMFHKVHKQPIYLSVVTDPTEVFLYGTVTSCDLCYLLYYLEDYSWHRHWTQTPTVRLCTLRTIF